LAMTVNLLSDERFKGKTHCPYSNHWSSDIFTAGDNVKSTRLPEACLQTTSQKYLSVLW
jgi:hypothetical protein